MANVYEDEPDARQSDDVNMKTSRFRPKYRALTDEEKELHDQIKDKADELEALYNRINIKPPEAGRLRSIAITNLEISVSMAIKELTK